MTPQTYTRNAGLSRLHTFASDTVAHYAKRRNTDYGRGAHIHVSTLSPYIRHRLILEHEVLDAVLEKHTATSVDKFTQEVFWRGYFKGWLEQHPDVWRRYKRNLVTQVEQINENTDLSERYQTAINGQTGIACFDHWTEELIATAYLHNHARMWFASIWIFTLRLPWELGADFFLRHLIDGDPAANTCSWRWVGGLHTQGKTYLAREDNITKFTAGRFPNTPGLAPDAVPLLEPELPDRRPFIPPVLTLKQKRYGLILTEEDCHPESLVLPHPPSAILALTNPTERSVLPMGQLARDIGPAVTEDAARRAEIYYAQTVKRFSGTAWHDGIKDWANQNSLDIVVTPFLPVGPVKTRFTRAFQELDNLELQQVIRRYDTLVWPHAKAGFFGLKKKIPKIIKDLNSQGDLFSF